MVHDRLVGIGLVRKEISLSHPRFSPTNTITFGLPSTLLHFVTPNGGRKEGRKGLWKGNHSMVFGTRKKGMRDDEGGREKCQRGGNQTRKHARPTMDLGPACGRVCHRSLWVTS